VVGSHPVVQTIIIILEIYVISICVDDFKQHVISVEILERGDQLVFTISSIYIYKWTQDRYLRYSQVNMQIWYQMTRNPPPLFVSFPSGSSVDLNVR